MALKYTPPTKAYLHSRGLLSTGQELPGIDTTFKFGHNDNIGTSFSVVSESGLYRTPTPANAVNLRIKSGGSVLDTAAGTGARKVVLIGLDENGTDINEVVTLAGASSSAATTLKYMRLFRAAVIESGVYATDLLGGGHASTIVIEDSAGTEDWALIKSNGFPDAQSQIGAFSVGTGKRAYLTALNLFVDTNKAVDFILVFRSDIMNTSVIQPVRVGSELSGVEGAFSFVFSEPPRFFEHTDVALLAKVTTGSAKVSVNMTFIRNANGEAGA